MAMTTATDRLVAAVRALVAHKRAWPTVLTIGRYHEWHDTRDRLENELADKLAAYDATHPEKAIITLAERAADERGRAALAAVRAGMEAEDKR